MCNRIAHYCKILDHLKYLILSFILFNDNTWATTIAVNVYLKLADNNAIVQRIQLFNQQLKQTRLGQKVRPFLEDHLPHITLYLADYDEKKLPQLLARVKQLSKKQSVLKVKQGRFLVLHSNYVMLALRHNNALQQLSTKSLMTLYDLRDRRAEIPVWAAANPTKKALFTRYGSPNILTEFQPHLSIMVEPEQLCQKEQKQLNQQLHRLVNQLNRLPSLTAKAVMIGVGIADKNGQIIKELNTYPLVEEYRQRPPNQLSRNVH